jgi:ABC-2 type transport system permease protein
MKMKPGSWTWLLGYEIRLSWRAVSTIHLRVFAAAGGLLWILMHWGAWVSLPGGYKFIKAMLEVPIFAGGLFWLFASLSVSQTMVHTVNVLIDRGDLDLLLSSPLSQRTVFLVRGLSIAAGAVLLPAFALLPVAHVGLLRGFPGLMGIYPVLIAAALGCAAAGILLTMTLMRLLGARRARTAGQISAAFIGVAFFLAFQIPNALSAGTKAAAAAWLKSQVMGVGILGPACPLWWPVRAMFGEVLPLLAVVGIGAGGFWLAISLTYRRFITGTQETITGGGRVPSAAADKAGPVFRSGLVRVLLFKEWKLVLRDMQVISQSLLQILYLIPMVLIGFKSGPQNSFIVPVIVAAASMLAGNLAWITINAEDAPELVATAPVPIARVLRIKAAAAVLPVLAVLLPLAAWWSPRGPLAAATLLLCGAGGMVCAALIQIWSPRAGNRRDLKNRHKQGGPAGFIELGSTVGWIGIAVCAGGYWNWLPLAAGAVAAALLTAWGLGRSAREEVWGLGAVNAVSR